MITIRKPNGPLFFKYIDSIIVDDPQLRNNIRNDVYFNRAVEGLKVAYAGKEYIRSKFRTRQCANCYCRSNYRYQLPTNKLDQIFLPIQ